MATDGGRRLPAVWTRLASAFFEWNHSMTAAPGSSPIQALLDSLHARYAGFRDGEVAAYIPELAKADPDLFGICLATADGFVYESGDSRHEFTIQSISKPFVYGLALDGDPTDAVDVYFQQCSISVRCVDLALMGATLANQGVNPVTGERAIEDAHVENVLSVMASCGMYDFSGGWIYNVGMPAKSGVAGGVLAVLPGQLGIGVFSPRLDEQGNSARALKVCEELSRIWQLHQFNPPYSPQSSRRLSYTAAERSSTRTRHSVERACLREHGTRIRMVEIQGNLAFSTTEPIVRWIIGQADESRTVILDFLHVTAINSAAARLLAELADDLTRRGTAILFTHTQRFPALREQVAACRADAVAVDRMFRFHSTDQALEWCEDQLLSEMMPATTNGIGDLRSFEVAAGLTDEELEVLGGLLARQTYATGELVIRLGDDATNLFLITKGRVGVWLGEPGKGTRVASFSVGTMVGELAFIDGERRSANVVAETELECGVLEAEGFFGLQDSHPRIHATILRNIGASLATKLRRAFEHLSVLSTQTQ